MSLQHPSKNNGAPQKNRVRIIEIVEIRDSEGGAQIQTRVLKPIPPLALADMFHNLERIYFAQSLAPAQEKKSGLISPHDGKELPLIGDAD